MYIYRYIYVCRYKKKLRCTYICLYRHISLSLISGWSMSMWTRCLRPPSLLWCCADQSIGVGLSNRSVLGCPIKNVKRFRGGLIFAAHRLLYHSTLDSRVTKKKKKGCLIDSTVCVRPIDVQAAHRCDRDFEYDQGCSCCCPTHLAFEPRNHLHPGEALRGGI